MTLEVYKLELGSTQGGFPRDWAFYWQVGNQSGRNQQEISGDLADKLAVSGLWLFRFQDFWSKVQKVHKFRIRKVFPTFEPWNDYYWRFRHLGGSILAADELHNVRLRIAWWTAAAEVTGACTYLDCKQLATWSKGLWTGNALVIAENWASLHDSIQTTSHGDQFRPAILDRFGNYNPILGHWIDPRPVSSQRHQIRV